VDSSEGVVSITGCHYGYKRYIPDMKVFRKAEWNAIERTILISDWIESQKFHMDMMFTWYFLLNPDWTGVMEDGTLVLKNEVQTVYFANMNGIAFMLTQGFYCPNYQVESRVQVLAASCEARPGNKIDFLLWY
jgi:hypothetical protein